MRIAISSVDINRKSALCAELQRLYPFSTPEYIHQTPPEAFYYNSFSRSLRYHMRGDFITTNPLYDIYATVDKFINTDEKRFLNWMRILRKIRYTTLFYIPSEELMQEDSDLRLILDFFHAPYNILQGTITEMVEQAIFVLGWHEKLN